MVSFDSLVRIVCSDKQLDILSALPADRIEDAFGHDVRVMFDYGDQHNPYHIYTLWQHTLHTVKGVDSGNADLRVAAFFHDVGKPVTGFAKKSDPSRYVYPHHAEASAKIAESVLNEMGCPDKDLRKILFLIRYHDASWNGGIVGCDLDFQPYLDDLNALMTADVMAQAEKTIRFDGAVVTRESKISDGNAFVAGLRK